MSSINIAALINFVGFTVGAALYAMLLVMALMTPPRVSVVGWRKSWVPGSGLSANVLLAATAVLGLLWNVGALATYGVFNLLGSYTVARPHYAHIFSVNAFNLGDRLYRNHLSFIKERAPEIGRGVRFAYTVRFF